jgi:hypothetical protein
MGKDVVTLQRCIATLSTSRLGSPLCNKQWSAAHLALHLPDRLVFTSAIKIENARLGNDPVPLISSTPRRTAHHTSPGVSVPMGGLTVRLHLCRFDNVWTYATSESISACDSLSLNAGIFPFPLLMICSSCILVWF